MLFGVAGAKGEVLVQPGAVLGEWTAASSPYVIQGDIWIDAGESLVVEPDVVVSFETGAGLEIRGTLTAVGEEGRPIRFTSAAGVPAPGDWTGIVFRSAPGGSELAHCIVEYATKGITCDNSDILLVNSAVQHNDTMGISIVAKAEGCDSESSEPTLRGCTFSYNGSYGVSYSGGGDAIDGCSLPKHGIAGGTLTDCDIHHNGGGVSVFAYNGFSQTGGASPPLIMDNDIHDNTGDGIHFGGDDSTEATVYDNRITDNGGAGIHCDKSSYGPSISYNRIARNGAQGVYVNNGRTDIDVNEIVENAGHGVEAVAIGSLRGNNIFDNTGLALRYGGVEDLSAPDNYWGSADPAVIEGRIETGPGAGTVLLPSFQTSYDTEPPAVAEVYPADGADGIAPGLMIRAAFSEWLKEDTVPVDVVTVTDGVNEVAGDRYFLEDGIWFFPSSPLRFDTEYTVVIQSGIQDVHYSRNTMATPYSWSFKTKADCGGRCPGGLVHYENLSSWATGLAHDGEQFWFIELDGKVLEPNPIYRMDEAGIVLQRFMSQGDDPYGLTWADGSLWCGDTSSDTIYRLDTDGNVISHFPAPGPTPTGLAFDGAYLWVADRGGTIFKLNMAGEVIDRYPTFRTTYDVAFDGTFIWYARFDRIFKMDRSGEVVDSITPPGRTRGLTFDGTYLWASYRTDTGINRLGKLRISYPADTTPPTVSEVRPPDGSVGVGVGTGITATFEDDTDIDPGTVTSDTVILSDGVSPVSGTLRYADNTLRFIPSERLAFGTPYTATLTTDIRDLAGNPLPRARTWSFTTRDACPDPCPGEVADAFDAPLGHPTGLAHDGGHLLVSEGGRIYRVTGAGEVMGSFTAPADSGNGLGCDGTDLWLVNAADRTVYRSTLQGFVRDQFSLPLNFSSPAGLAFDGKHLWVGHYTYTHPIYRFDLSGNIVGSVPLPELPTGIAVDGETVWVVSDHTDTIYRIDPEGHLLNSFPSPGPQPYGLAFDGVNLWCGDLETGRIYQLPLTQLAGDVTGDYLLDLQDPILALKILCGMPVETLGKTGDVDNDGAIGLAEAVYGLRKAAHD